MSYRYQTDQDQDQDQEQGLDSGEAQRGQQAVMPDEFAYGNAAMNALIAAEGGDEAAGNADQGEEQAQEHLGPNGFDYHGSELVDPAVAALPGGEITGAIYDQIFADNLPAGAAWHHLPPEDQEAAMASAQEQAELAVARYEAMLEEELADALSPELMRHLPPEDQEAAIASAREAALHRLNVGHTGGIGEVDLSQMSPGLLYNYLHDLTLRSGGEWTEEDLELNLVGVRGLDNGTLNEDNEGNAYNDTLYAARMVDGEPQVVPLNATTDYGDETAIHNYDASYGVNGDYWMLAPGSYQYNINSSASDPQFLLTSTADERVALDKDHDRWVDEDETVQNSNQGLYIHAGGTSENVGSWSAGCQVIQRRPSGVEAGTPNDDGEFYYEDLLAMVKEDPRYATDQAGTTQTVTYTLADAHDLK